MKEREASFKKRKLIAEKSPTGVSSMQTTRKIFSRKKKTACEYYCSSVKENMHGHGTVVQARKRKRLSSGFAENDSPSRRKSSFSTVAVERKRIKHTFNDSFPAEGSSSQTQKLSEMASKQFESFKDSASPSKNIITKKREKVFSEKGGVVEGRQKYLRVRKEKDVLTGSFVHKAGNKIGSKDQRSSNTSDSINHVTTFKEHTRKRKLTGEEEGRQKQIPVEGQNGNGRSNDNKAKNGKGNIPEESFGISRKRTAFTLAVPNGDKDEISESKIGKRPRLSPLVGQIKSKKRLIAELARNSTGKRVHYTTSPQTLSKKRKLTGEYFHSLFTENDKGTTAISEGESSLKRLRQTLLKKRKRSVGNSSSYVNEDDMEGRMEPLKKKVALETVEINEDKDLDDHWKSAMGGHEAEDSLLDYWRGELEYLKKVDEFLKSVAVEEVQASFRKWMLRDPCDAPLYPNPRQVEEEKLFSSWLAEIRNDSQELEEPEETFSD